MDLAFLLMNEAKYPDAKSVMASAEKIGIPMTLTKEGGDGPMTFELRNGGSFMAQLVEAPHPDVATMGFGPTSPDPDDAAAAKAHFILTALGLEGDERTRDTQMAALAATLIQNCDAVGAMLGHGVVFHKAKLFAEMAALGAEVGALPAEVAVDFTIAGEPDDRMSFLTHGMERYGREEFFITCPVTGRGALDFALGMARWLLDDPDKTLPTGDTVGRTAEEKIIVQRVPNPTGEGKPVVRLDLDS